jgi:hypothetical protein
MASKSQCPQTYEDGHLHTALHARAFKHGIEPIGQVLDTGNTLRLLQTRPILLGSLERIGAAHTWTFRQAVNTGRPSVLLGKLQSSSLDIHDDNGSSALSLGQ